MTNEESNSMLDLSFDNVVEYEAVPEGEYQLRIDDIVAASGEKGPYVRAVLLPVGNDMAKTISHVMMLPQANDEPRKKNNRLLALRSFYEAFGVDYTSGPVNLEDLKGLTAWAFLRVETSDTYGEQNQVRRWITGA